MTTVLIIEDDSQIRRVAAAYLRQAGYEVVTAVDGLSGLALAEQMRPRLLVLDLLLPHIGGLEIARRVRAAPDPAVASMYIIMLTARVEEGDRVQGLELGADDYVTKPFSPRELVARVRAALRRLDKRLPAPPARLHAGALALDPAARLAALADRPLELTVTEFHLLHHLAQHPGRTFSRDELLDVIDPEHTDDPAQERTVDAHIKNLRRKLGQAGRRNTYIETVYGAGYRFTPALEPERPESEY